MIVIDWLIGEPLCSKKYVGNRVSEIVELIPPDCWRLVSGNKNPTDSASRGLLPSELFRAHYVVVWPRLVLS